MNLRISGDFITGPHTHIVYRGSIVLLAGVCRRRRLSSSVVVCNTPHRHICNVTHQESARDGGPIVLRPVGATPCWISGNLTSQYVISYPFHFLRVRYCTTNFTGSTSPNGCFSSWQWQFTGVWTAAHRRTCRTTAFRPPVSTLGSTCVPLTVDCLQYLATGSTLTAVGPFQFCCRPHSLELSPWFHPGPNYQCRLFQTFA